MISSGLIRLSTSDKGGEFVVIPQQLDKAITEEHLRDDTLYRTSSAKEFQAQYRHLNREWVKVARTAGLPRSFIARLKIELPSCPVLYLLVKTHKLSSVEEFASMDPTVFKVRPIISCVGGPTDRIAWFLNVILAQLLNYIPSHLTNTQMFLNRLRSMQLEHNCVVESFDVTALYTNVSNERALQAIFELLIEYQGNINMHGLAVAQIMVLLQECLRCTIFRWSGNYFAQTRGLAMGQRLAPTLAIAFMSRIEAPVLELCPLLYCRYIDDCFVVCTTQEEMDMCFELLNNQSEHIKFTREKPKNDWLPFLNVQVHIRGGSRVTKWYRKPNNKNIIVHCRSAHPQQMKRAVVKNMFRTAAEVCSGEAERKESIALAKHIAASNGYKVGGSNARSRRLQAPRSKSPKKDKIPFKLPFVSDEVSTAIRRCLRKVNLDSLVTVVDLPPDNLKRQLVRNRLYDRFCPTPGCIICPNGKGGDCMGSGIIYLISCSECGDEYIGETARPLCLRIKEHLEGKARSRESTPLGAHRLHRHGGADFGVKVSILAHEQQISARKSLEAFWIHAKNPKMNRKEECLSITRELAPYIRMLF
ncbi:hypothetical protein Y032_0521g2875 [Ancylostoma ceylanicum]|uniref:Reverse transcriptase domain-containing protein n=1 Tax=Ancylostoma ceylanicum TaxID=53326 RepID=A0A016WSX8_9BILA|nr:hypothetical protein Y032_0521g2875 [Ancylostoma ceylanicum]